MTSSRSGPLDPQRGSSSKIVNTRAVAARPGSARRARGRTRAWGPGSRTAGLAMVFKVIEAAQARWRVVNAPHLVALLRAGGVFVNGKLVERPNAIHRPAAA